LSPPPDSPSGDFPPAARAWLFVLLIPMPSPAARGSNVVTRGSGS